MNFLAHLYLSPDEAGWLIGSILPDLVRPLKVGELDEQVATGVVLHRHVDAFTDTHPIVHRSKGRIRARHGIYAGILIDLFYDHFLAADWPGYHDQPLDGFSAHVYEQFASHPQLMPPAMHTIVEQMAQHNWLCMYAQIDGIEHVLGRMSDRFSRKFNRNVQLTGAVDDLREHYDDLQSGFTAFFGQLVDSARRAAAQL